VLFVVVLASLVVQLGLVVTGGTDVNVGATTGHLGLDTRLVNLFSFFTIQSNLVVLVTAATLVADPFRDGRRWRILRLDALLGIVITGIVFATVLAGLVHHTGVSAWVNAGLHYVSPWVTLAGWLLFGPRPRITWRTVGWAFVWPVAWLAYTFIRGAATGWYPYPFLDVARHGYPTVARNSIAVLLLAAALAALLKLLDHRLPSPHELGSAAQRIPT